MQKHVALVNQIKRPLGKGVLNDTMPEHFEVARLSLPTASRGQEVNDNDTVNCLVGESQTGRQFA